MEQCPYDRAIKCKMDDPCLGCEEYKPGLLAASSWKYDVENVPYSDSPRLWLHKSKCLVTMCYDFPNNKKEYIAYAEIHLPEREG